ncbi:MAG TPA: ChbG/HpnK family deacetylase [Candidatus Sulfotelmatobacter sp.]|nr:ChbG/HpnK family deacetylase [Candidatus Sulfotelmatobacter sp.]
MPALSEDQGTYKFEGAPDMTGPLAQSGALIINADDWGRDTFTTERILECFKAGGVSSASAMVFMEDSERAADLAKEAKIDVGLHLNLTTGFSKPKTSKLAEYQQRLAKYLRRNRLAPVIFHPGLTRCFEYVVSTQIDEFERLHDAKPIRIDGHHHMHLCANVLMARLLPEGTIVRRNFSFRPGEKSFANRSWRKAVDSMLARRHRLTDFFFSLPPMDLGRLQSIFGLASQSIVELETHPVNSEEYALLTSEAISKWSSMVKLSSFSRALT